MAFGNATLERMVRAVEKVRDRLLRATAALEASGVPYAVAGGNAVAAHVAEVDESAVRNTADVDLLIRRADLPAAVVAMQSAGFVWRHAAGIDMFMDGPQTTFRDAVHVLFAAEKVRETYDFPAADVTDSVAGDRFRVVSLDALVRMKLTSYRRKDQVHLLDFIAVGLIDETWPARLPEPLAGRLQALLDDPEG